MRSSLLLLLACLAVPASISAVGKEALLATKLVPRQVRVSFAAEQVFVSVRTMLEPKSQGERTWARWDRDGDGSLSAPELAPLTAELRRQELGHLGISVDGEVIPLRELAMRVETPKERPVGLNAPLLLRFEGKHPVSLAAGRHRFTVYDQPRGKDGVVPFRVGFARGFKAVTGAGARGEIKNSGTRLEVATTKLAPMFWGVFERIDEAKPATP